MGYTSDKHPLFRASSSYGNIVLNFQNAADNEFGFYAHAFHKAGKTLFEQMFARASYNDLEGCPILFLYRHAIELYLKAIILYGNDIMCLTGKY